MSDKPAERIRELLRQLYPAEQAETTYSRLIDLLQARDLPQSERREALFSERDVTLITYGDTLQQEGEAPLKTLHRFLSERLKGTISTVHILPFYPYSSDDGFSVIDYYAVNPALGGWDDVARFGGDFRLMFDAVINHMSAKSAWFKAFLNDVPEFRRMFMTASPQADLSAVTRPRTSPLLTAFPKSRGGTVHLWTTFSDDQIDLNFGDPETLLRILDVLLFYVEQGADVIRLDAIAYMWKEVGTSSIHLPQTHAVIQLMRAALDVVAPQVVLITETNVPHAENISYFGNGHNEAQMVYNFTLPPLLLHTMLSGDASKMAAWINTLQAPSERTTFFNFTASHDGIGVRPVEGILSPEELNAMIAAVEQRGGMVSYRQNVDGSRVPYELNITYVDAIIHPDMPYHLQHKQFMMSQGIMLALAGVPAIYIHSLLGTHNDRAGVEKTGHNRSINRAKLSVSEIEAELNDAQSWRARIFNAYSQLIVAHVSHPAFHPKAPQYAYNLNEGAVLGIERMALDGSERILALFNVTNIQQAFILPGQAEVDILTGNDVNAGAMTLMPYHMCWLRMGL